MSTRVISFSSGKGGVGKTSLVANCGALWARAGRRVLLVDGDWNLGKLSIALGVKPQWTVEKVLKNEISLNDAIQQVSPGLSLLASPTGVIGFEELTDVDRAQIFFEMETLADKYDLILLDHASGIHSAVLEFAAASHQHVVVTTPEPTSYTDAYAIMKLLSKRFAIRQFSLLVTMSQHADESSRIISRFIDVATSHLEIRLNLLDILPWEPKLGEAIRKQRPFVDLEPDSALAHRLSNACDKIDRSPIAPHHGLKFFYDGLSKKRDELCQA